MRLLALIALHELARHLVFPDQALKLTLSAATKQLKIKRLEWISARLTLCRILNSVECEMLMACYFRHMHGVFQKAGIEVNPNNRRRIDQVIHRLAGEEYTNCPDVWREVKKRLALDEAKYVEELKSAYKTQSEL